MNTKPKFVEGIYLPNGDPVCYSCMSDAEFEATDRPIFFDDETDEIVFCIQCGEVVTANLSRYGIDQLCGPIDLEAVSPSDLMVHSCGCYCTDHNICAVYAALEDHRYLVSYPYGDQSYYVRTENSDRFAELMEELEYEFDL